ncbi:MAG: hypothetical protein U0T83_08255 [Bacteriovoracaceae bacterium]
MKKSLVNMRNIILLLLLVISFNLQARNLSGRLGIGMTNHFHNDIPCISLKLQRSKSYALGLEVGTKFSDTDGGYATGLKFYRIIFDEPQLNFYGALMGAMLSQKTAGVSKSGYQFDGTLGTEFHFAGLESLGFSFEFGLSINKLGEKSAIETVGDSMIVGAVHFYL